MLTPLYLLYYIAISALIWNTLIPRKIYTIIFLNVKPNGEMIVLIIQIVKTMIQKYLNEN